LDVAELEALGTAGAEAPVEEPAGLKVGVHSLAETEGMNSLVGGFRPFVVGFVFTLLFALLFTARVLEELG
jgi:hypothetical protein